MSAPSGKQRLWCPECFYRLGRALLVWTVVGGLIMRRRRRRRLEQTKGR